MARLLDLPQEIRSEIYKLLLLDPLQEGLRAVFCLDPLDSNRIYQCCARCSNTDLPHEGHSTHACHSDIPYRNLQHLYFTDLMSLARANKTLYAEASKPIYEHADLTLSFYSSEPMVRPAGIPALFSRYLEQHCPATTAMLHTLAINDNNASMSSGGTRFIVDLVNTRMPNLRVFKYHLSITVDTYSLEFLQMLCQTFIAVQPFARLRAEVRTFFTSDRPNDLGRVSQASYSFLGDGCRQRLISRAIDGATETVNNRRRIRNYHASALDHDSYLQATLALRSTSELGVESDQRLDSIEDMLMEMCALANPLWLRRRTLRAARHNQQYLH